MRPFMSRSHQRHADDLIGVHDRAIVVLVALLDGVDMLHAFGDAAPYRVFAVKPWRGVEADEELAVRRIRTAAARHGAGAAHIAFAREFPLPFRLLRPPPPSPA